MNISSLKNNRFLRLTALIIIIKVITGVTFVKAQTSHQDAKKDVSKKDRHELHMADAYFENFEFYLAAQEYEKVVQQNPNNKYALFRLAESYRMFFNYDKAELYYRKAAQISVEELPVSQFWYALILKTNGKYEQAKIEFKKYLDLIPAGAGSDEQFNLQRAELELQGCELALEEMKKPQRNYHFHGLPSPVNTQDSEYSPTIAENDSSLILSSARDESTGGKEYGGLGGKFSDDYRFVWDGQSWQSRDDPDDFSHLNTKFNESAGSFTKDGKRFYFSRCDVPIKNANGTDYQCGIFVTQLIDGKWSDPLRLNDNINAIGEWNAQPSISPNGDTLFFVSKRPGGLGMHDIWYSTCAGNDHWRPAINMGSKINTRYIDMSPNYYAKEGTLFFASNGIKGFGGLDIFKAKGPAFSQVSTAGLPFNSNRDDFYFVLGDKKGFLASNRQGGKGNDDIYSFNIEGEDAIIAFIDKDSMEKVKSITVEGRLISEDTKAPVEDVEVLLKDGNNNTLKITMTDEFGHFKYEDLPVDKSYIITLHETTKKLTSEVNYISDSLQIKGSNQEVSRTLFEHVFFDFNRYDLRPEATKALDELVEYYTKYPEIQIEMEATTDDIGSSDYNKKLSHNRGQAALDYLMSHGVKKSALVVSASGEDKPLVPNNNHIARQLNRRVEFFIIGGPGYVSTTTAYVMESPMEIGDVARKFGMTVEELMKMNNIRKNKLPAFKPLRVRRTGDNDIISPVTLAHLGDADIQENVLNPELNTLSEEQIRSNALKHAYEIPTGQEFYTVQPNNTLYSIAKLNKLTPDEIIALNNLKDHKIFVGQKLKVRKPQAVLPIESEEIENEIIQDGVTGYLVKPGETLVSVAKKFSLTPEEIISLNHLSNPELEENMVIRVRKQ